MLTEYQIKNIDKKIDEMVEDSRCYFTERIYDLFPFFSGAESFWAFKIESQEDIDVINKWTESWNKNDDAFIDAYSIGRIVLFCQYDFDNAVYYFGTPESLKDNYCRSVDSLCGYLLAKGGENE